ncbi:phenoloxidase-activating factor 2-like [Drosophila rhopaloa]|uniref:Peptidase S1 domain-containing protein n=1 Tax=Drosophila rhopaloa TaxID=1041015 RepID=A0ABM5I754_DRORH|nr:phenoloxidase-activating factor 2-like [Drosophila rhopaloa]
MFRFWAIGALLLCIICNSDAVPCNTPNHCVAGGTCKNKVIGTCFFSEECCAPAIGWPQVTQNGLLEGPQSKPTVPWNPNPEPQEHANPIKPNFPPGSLNSNQVPQIQQHVLKNSSPEPPGQDFLQPVIFEPNPEQPEFVTPEPTKSPNPEPPNNQIPDERRDQRNPAPPSQQPKLNDPYDEYCGWSNRNQLFASEPVPVRHQYPWTIALFNHGNYFASGSLVSPGVVVTVAHLINTTNIVARAGDYDFLLRVEQFPPDERHVARIQIHDNYQPQNGANNIALLFLESPFTLRTHIRTICLPQQYKSFDSKRCVTAGWSKFSDMKLQDSDVQAQKELTVAQKDCQNIFKGNYQRPGGLICTAGVGDDNACTVDSGSPLFCPLENQPHRYELAGISSRNYGCGQERVVSLFTDVAELSGWIKGQLQQGVEGNPGKITPKMG